LNGEPTTRGETTYDRLSPELLKDAERGIQESGREPIVVVASVFNRAGANTDFAVRPPTGPANDVENPTAEDFRVWDLEDGRVTPQDPEAEDGPDDAGPVHLIRVILGLAVLLLPGALGLRRLLPDAHAADAFGLAPALCLGLLTLSGIIVLSIFRAAFSLPLAILTVALPLAPLLLMSVRSRTRARPAA